MKLGIDRGSLVGWDAATSAWVVVGEPWDHDMLAFLAGGAEAVRAAQATFESPARTEGQEPSGLPVVPSSLRAFALWESHMVNGARGMVSAFASPGVKRVANGFESLTGKTFPPLKPKGNYYRDPQFYMGNHRSVVADGTTVAWPSFAGVLDFELEMGMIIARPVKDCTAAEGLAAIGGFVIMNDWSARDTQWDDTRSGTFGGVVKAKTFAGSMSAVVVTADEVLPRWSNLTGRVLVNGQEWASSSTADALHDLGAAVAYAARGEYLNPGDVLSTGTLPGLCGLEMRRFPQPGDTVRLELDLAAGEAITLTNVLGESAAAAAARATATVGDDVGATVVTGCDSGIGKALARAFHAAGRTVYATGLREESMEDLASAGLRTAVLDVTDPASADALVKRLDADGVVVDLLVNNAGYGAMGPVIEMPMDDVRRQYEVNVFGLLNTTQKLAEQMIAHGRGTIVNVGSTSGVMTSPFAGVYCSTKSAVHALNDAMRMELAPFGITVVRVEPNQIRTNFGDTAAAGLAARVSTSSRYVKVLDAMNARAQGSQSGNAMPAEEFARKVAEAVLSANPPVRLRLGRELWPYTVFKPFLPSRRIDAILSKRFQLDRVHAMIGRTQAPFEFARPRAAAVVTGAAAGIGAATALELARRGADLALVDRAPAETTATQARALGVRVTVHTVDVTDTDAVLALAAEVETEHGGTHVLVNCAGVSLLGYFEQLTLEEFKWLLDVNLWGTIAVTKAFLPQLMTQPTAHISNLSSGYGLVAPAGRTPYATSKFAVRGFTEAITHELEDTGVSVSVVHPGGIKTQIAMKARAAAGIPAEVANKVASSQTAMYKTTPETAGLAIVDGIARRRPRVMIGNDVRLLDALARLAPTHHWALLRGSLKNATDTRGTAASTAATASKESPR